MAEFNKGAYESSIPFFERAIALKPDYATAHYNLGTTNFYLKR